LFGITVIALMWPFLFTTGAPGDNLDRWWLLVAFVLAATAFVAWERHYAASGRHPLVPLSLFGVPSFRNGTVLAAAFFAAMPPMFLLTTLYLQHGLGLEAVFAGMVGIGFALVSAIGSWLGGNLVNRIGRPLVVWGLAAMLLGVGLLVLAALFTPPAITPWAMAAAMIVGGAGGGFVISPNQTLALADIPVKQGGLAGSVGQLGQRIGTAVGTAVALSLFYATIYRESGSADTQDLGIYHDAYGFGMLAVAVFIATAFAIGLADLGARRRQRRSLADTV
jgi:MFS family permease